MSMKIPIPSDWDGTSWLDMCVQWPDSQEWLAIWTGMITQVMRGRFWDERTGSVKDAQLVGTQIWDRNEEIVGCGSMGVTDIHVDCENGKLVVSYSDGTTEDLDLSCLYPKVVEDVVYRDQWKSLELQFTDGLARLEPLNELTDNLLEFAVADCENRVLKFTRADGTQFNILIDCLLPSHVELVYVDLQDKEIRVTYNDEGTVVFDLNTWFNGLVEHAWIDCELLEFGTRKVDGLITTYDLSDCMQAGAGIPPKIVYPITIPEPDNCDIAWNAYLVLLDMRDTIGAGLAALENASQLAVRMGEVSKLVMPPTNPAYFLWFTELIEGQSAAWWAALMTNQEVNDFGCAYFCTLESTESTKEQYLDLIDYLNSKYPTPEDLAYSFFLSILQVWGVNGLYNSFVVYQTTGNDCSACVCPGEPWCYTFDFLLSDGGWGNPDSGDFVGVWSSGVGWIAQLHQGVVKIRFGRDMTPDTTVTSVTVNYTATMPATTYDSSIRIFVDHAKTGELMFKAQNGANQIAWSGNAIGDIVDLRLWTSGEFDSLVITSVEVCGLGDNPFVV